MKISDSEEYTLNVAAGKKIKNQNSFLSLQGKFPVICLDFRLCTGLSVAEIQARLIKHIFNTLNNFCYLENSQLCYSGSTTVGERYKEILEQTRNKLNCDALKDLSELLFIYHKKKVWILVDEYDAAANIAYLEFSAADAKQVSFMFRQILETALKGNPNLEKGVIVGVQFLLKSGILLGLNNLSLHNINSNKYSKYFGVSDEELSLLLRRFHIEEKEQQVKDWYGGYIINVGTGVRPVYEERCNTWSVFNYLAEVQNGLKSYWENGNLSEAVKVGLLRNLSVRDIFERLIKGQSVLIKGLITDFSVENFETLKHITSTPGKIEINQNGVDLICSYLFIAGYLTATSVANEYKIPNRQIKLAFEKIIKEYYQTLYRIPPELFHELNHILGQILSEEDPVKVSSIMKEIFAPKLSHLLSGVTLISDDDERKSETGLYGNEDLVHSMLNYIAMKIVNAEFATEQYTTKPTESRGRSDVVIAKKHIAGIFELKYEAASTNEALLQAKEYAALVGDRRIKVLVGCNVTAKKQVFLCGEVVSSDAVISFSYP